MINEMIAKSEGLGVFGEGIGKLNSTEHNTTRFAWFKYCEGVLDTLRAVKLITFAEYIGKKDYLRDKYWSQEAQEIE